MGKHVSIRGKTPQEAFLNLLPVFDRDDIEAAVDILIEKLDRIAGDPDLEDGEGVDFVDARGSYLFDGGPGNEEDREPEDDAKGDVSWSEWHTRARHKTPGGHEAVRGPGGLPIEEDDEDDDPDTAIEDDPRGFDPEEDFGAEEADEPEDGQ